jgi:hypothetical protein
LSGEYHQTPEILNRGAPCSSKPDCPRLVNDGRRPVHPIANALACVQPIMRIKRRLRRHHSRGDFANPKDATTQRPARRFLQTL